MKFSELLNYGSGLLNEAHIVEYKNDAWILLSEACSITRSQYLMKMSEEVPELIEKSYIDMIKKRTTHIPLQYIIGSWDFMGLNFIVNENVLIPRQDTECLVEETVKLIDKQSKFKVLDMCTGSGCIAISIAKLCVNADVTAVDLSSEALSVAKQNAAKILRQDNKTVNFIQSDLFENITGSFDIIVSNPPYIKTSEIDTLMPEVRDYEPMMALDGDDDGLLFYRRIIKSAPDILKPDGYILFEIGCTQGLEVKEMLEENGFSEVRIVKDLPGLDRVVIGKNGGN